MRRPPCPLWRPQALARLVKLNAPSYGSQNVNSGFPPLSITSFS